MKLKIAEIRALSSVIEKITHNAIEDPRKSYSLYKMISKYNEVVGFFEKEKGKLLDLYGEPLKEGSSKYKIHPEHLKEFNDKISELLDMEEEVPEINITMEDFLNSQFPDGEKYWYSPADCAVLEHYLEVQEKSKNHVESSVK